MQSDVGKLCEYLRTRTPCGTTDWADSTGNRWMVHFFRVARLQRAFPALETDESVKEAVRQLWAQIFPMEVEMDHPAHGRCLKIYLAPSD